MKATSSLQKSIHEYGFKELRVVECFWDKPFTHPLYYGLFAECVRHNIIFLQIGLTQPLVTSEIESPLLIERVPLGFPKLKIVCVHISYP